MGSETDYTCTLTPPPPPRARHGKGWAQLLYTHSEAWSLGHWEGGIWGSLLMTRAVLVWCKDWLVQGRGPRDRGLGSRSATPSRPSQHSKRRRLVGSLASCALPSTWAFSHFPHVLSYSPSSLLLLFQSFSSPPSIVIHPVYCFKQPWQSGRHLEPQTTGCNKLENSAIWGKFFIHSSS